MVQNKTSYVSYLDPRRIPNVYYTHDNGGRPFLVSIDDDFILVYKDSSYEQIDSDTPTYDQLVLTCPVETVYIGKDLENKTSDGNSILLHVEENVYIYIGDKMYLFHMEDIVDFYFSPIGNSDVPYPILLGTQYVYFMLDHIYVPRTEFSPQMTKPDWQDVYHKYYSENMKGMTMKGFHILVDFLR